MDTTVVIALCVLGTAATAAYWLWYPTRFRKPSEPPKVRLGDQVTLMYGDVPIGDMILVEFSDTYHGGKEARLMDVASYAAGHRVD